MTPYEENMIFKLLAGSHTGKFQVDSALQIALAWYQEVA